jgi:hypothetical protein
VVFCIHAQGHCGCCAVRACVSHLLTGDPFLCCDETAISHAESPQNRSTLMSRRTSPGARTIVLCESTDNCNRVCRIVGTELCGKRFARGWRMRRVCRQSGRCFCEIPACVRVIDDAKLGWARQTWVDRQIRGAVLPTSPTVTDTVPLMRLIFSPFPFFFVLFFPCSPEQLTVGLVLQYIGRPHFARPWVSCSAAVALWRHLHYGSATSSFFGPHPT